MERQAVKKIMGDIRRILKETVLTRITCHVQILMSAGPYNVSEVL